MKAVAIKLVFLILSLFALPYHEAVSQSITKPGNTMKQHEASPNEEVIFIDKFFVPQSSATAFLHQMNYNRNFLRSLPGFISDEAFQQQGETGNLIIVTLARWENQASIDQAKTAMLAEFKRIEFNPLEFYQRLNIKLERGIYSLLHP